MTCSSLWRKCLVQKVFITARAIHEYIVMWILEDLWEQHICTAAQEVKIRAVWANERPFLDRCFVSLAPSFLFFFFKLSLCWFLSYRSKEKRATSPGQMPFTLLLTLQLRPFSPGSNLDDQRTQTLYQNHRGLIVLSSAESWSDYYSEKWTLFIQWHTDSNPAINASFKP